MPGDCLSFTVRVRCEIDLICFFCFFTEFCKKLSLSSYRNILGFKIIVYINNAQSIVNARGANSVNQLTTADRQAILAELTATTAVLDITVTVTSKKVVFSDAEGTVVAAFPTKGNGVK